MDQRTSQERERLQGLPPTPVRQGISLGRMRYVLGIALALVIIAFAIIWFLNF